MDAGKDNGLNLERTDAALRAYDALESRLAMSDDVTVVEAFSELERAGEAVGAAFGEDTKDRNSPETCRQCVRPGPSVPQVGFELSFVRRLVNEYRERKAKNGN